MNEREKKIAEAAIRAYSRLGVKRATMTEIAKEASVTRQTVYNTFPSTDDVLRAAIRYYIDDQWNKIHTGWRNCSSLGEKLDLLLLHFALEPWEYINSSPEAAEMERGYNDAGKAEVEAARLGFRDEVAQLFVPYKEVLATKSTSPHAVADFIGAAIEGIKYNNADRASMLVAIATLKGALISLTKD
ncbi:MAG: TetR/AcrR family transcriptional regulator [Pseudomonadota bacterium]